jgi:hypothetical protein
MGTNKEKKPKPVGVTVRPCPGDNIEVVEVTDFLGEIPAMLKGLANYLRETREGPLFVTVETHYNESGDQYLLAFVGGFG